jgi:LVIVD repeat
MRWSRSTRFGCLLLMLAACSEGKPQFGGQTGDPGVSDFTSLDPDPSPSAPGLPGGGSCIGAVQDLDSGRHYLPYGQPPLARLDSEHLVSLEQTRGLAVVDVSGPAPRLISRVPLVQGTGDLHVSGTRAIVSRRSPKPQAAYWSENGYPEIPEGAELLVIDLSDVSQPRVVERVTPEHAPRASYLVESGGSTRLYVLSDGGAPGGCAGPNARTRLTAYELSGDQLLERAELDLGAQELNGGYLQVAQSGSDLVVVRARNDAQHLSVISLASPDGALTESASIALDGHVFDVRQESSELLRVVTTSSTRELRVERYDIRDRSALVRQRTCDVPLSGGAWAFTSYGTLRAFFIGGTGLSGTNTLVSVADGRDGACDARVTQGRDRSALPVATSPSRVLEVDHDGAGSIVAQLRDEADLGLLSEATARPESAGGDLRIGFGPTLLRAPGAEEGVLSVLFALGSSHDSADRAVQLFSFTADGVRARGALLGAGAVVQTDEPHALTWSPLHGLGRLDLRDLDAPKVHGRLDLAPEFTRVWSYAGHWVRLRTAVDAERDAWTEEEFPDQTLWSPESRARLEIVPDDEDPDLGAPIASIDVNPWARFVRSGDLLVSVLSRDGSGPQPTRIEVYDLREPAQPRRAGTLELPALWLPDNTERRIGSYWGDQRGGPRCLDCGGADLDARVLAVPCALVLRSLDQAGNPVLQVLDLSDPDMPVLRDPIAPESGERILSAFAAGSSVYYVYRNRAEAADGAGGTPRARFYFRRIDLSQPARPALETPVNVPGQLVAVAGDDLFTREFVSRGGDVETVVHRLVLREGRAELRATHSFGSRMVFALQADGSGHLLADLGEPLADFLFERFYTPQPTDLRVLDAATLEQVGEARVGHYARRVDLHAGRALYSAAEGYVLMDLRDAAVPRFQRYFALLDPGGLRAELVGDSVIIRDRGALKRFDVAGHE